MNGLNTVVPYRDEQYYHLRPQLAIPRQSVLQLSEQLGFNPALEPLMPLWQGRELAIVLGVGYPNPNHSHFRSIEIWDTASKSRVRGPACSVADTSLPALQLREELARLRSRP